MRREFAARLFACFCRLTSPFAQVHAVNLGMNRGKLRVVESLLDHLSVECKTSRVQDALDIRARVFDYMTQHVSFDRVCVCSA